VTIIGTHGPETSPPEQSWIGLDVVRVRAEFVLNEPLLTHTLNGPMLRGTFGTALRTMYGRGGLYAALFDGGNAGGEVRQYRLRSPASSSAIWPTGSLLPFEIDLFGEATRRVQDLLPILVVMAHLGFGERRSSAKLHAVEQLLPVGSTKLVARGLSDRARFKPNPLSSHLPEVTRGVRFVGPLRLASRGRADSPILADVLRDVDRRLAALSGSPANPSFESATGYQWRDVRVISEERVSRREGVQALSGITGDLAPDKQITLRERRLLAAACIVGVGRHTTLGLGDCRPIP